MKSMTRPRFFLSIHGIPHNRVTNVGTVHTNLMGSSGKQAAFQNRHGVIVSNDSIGCDGFSATRPVDHSLVSAHGGVAPDVGMNSAKMRMGSPPDKSPVFFDHLAVRKGLIQKAVGFVMFGHN